MTIAIGLLDGKGGVIFGADRGQFDGDSVEAGLEPKITRHDKLLMVAAGSSRFSNIVRYLFRPPPRGTYTNDMLYMVSVFTEELRRVCNGVGFTQIENGREGHDSILLVGLRGRLYEIGGEWAVTRRSDQYAAIGSASAVALGALHMALHMGGTPGEPMVLGALETTEHLHSAVRGPFDIETLGVE